MREAIGATWIFGIVIVFIVVFTGYLAFSVNYAKAFAMKDSIIDILEKHNGPGAASSRRITEGATGSVLIEINDKMKNVNYYSLGNCQMVLDALERESGVDVDNGHVMGVSMEKAYVKSRYSYNFEKKSYNYCIIKQVQDSLNDQGLGFSNYFVATFFNIKIDIINMAKLDFNFFVSGQTKNIAYPDDGYLESGKSESEYA